ncbi:MAG TPA: ABC transporter substrate-binding protein [Candidatus Cybelea sp.]|nr:ABC transporter substrate-binding protein [Candidatus Cybelea sp.]
MTLGQALRLGPIMLGLAACLGSGQALAAKAYDPGVTDREIKLGQTMPYSGPLSAYGTIGKATAAYFAKINADGGVNGRKITLVSLDDSYSPPKTVEQTRKLVEDEGVFLLFESLGTPTNVAVQKYLNAAKVPQLFLQSGANRWNDPKTYPWSIPGLPGYGAEARIYAKYVLANKPAAKIAVLYQNDDFGKDFLKGFRDGLGAEADRMIVASQTYETTDPSVDSQIIALAGSGADTFFSMSLQRQTSQGIRKASEVNWHPLHFIPLVSNSLRTVLTPAGVERAAGIVSTSIYKDPSDPKWQSDAEYQAWLDWMKRYYPEGSTVESLNVAAYTEAALMVEVLRRCGDELTRENAIRQATSLRDLKLPMLLPGISVTVTPDDYSPFRNFQMIRFDGSQWVPLGAPVGG